MAITDAVLNELLKDYQKPEDLLGKDGLLKQLQKRLLEKAMGAELTTARNRAHRFRPRRATSRHQCPEVPRAGSHNERHSPSNPRECRSNERAHKIVLRTFALSLSINVHFWLLGPQLSTLNHSEIPPLSRTAHTPRSPVRAADAPPDFAHNTRT
jgi:hypothetical protein